MGSFLVVLLSVGVEFTLSSGITGSATWSDELSCPLQVENAAAAPTAQVSPARAGFDAISVRVPINGNSFDVAVPEETFGEARSGLTDIANAIRGDIGTRDQNKAVANYLLDREASDLLAKERADTITQEETELLKLHREKWKEDKGAETRAKGAGPITDTEAALLKVYRELWVRDTAGGLDVAGVRLRDDDYNNDNSNVNPNFGALVLCPSAESK